MALWEVEESIIHWRMDTAPPCFEEVFECEGERGGGESLSAVVLQNDFG